jgi:hypothetical protein
MSELPRIKRGDKTYYFDARLQQLRNVENPHDFIDLSPLETEDLKQKLQSPTKTCERCHGAIKKGEKCSETDVGSGKFVHWPTCPSRSPESHSPEKPIEQMSSRIKQEVQEAKNFLDDIVTYGVKPRSAHIAQKHFGDFMYSLGEIDALGVNEDQLNEAGRWSVELGTLIIDQNWEGIQKYIVNFKQLPLFSDPSGDPPPETTFIVDGLTLKDYYDLRDLRLFLMGLEKELIGKYGIIEAEPLSAKVRDLIKEKITEINNKIEASPEHHSNGDPDPINPSEIPTLGDFTNWLKKHNVTFEQFQAMPQSAKSLIYQHYKSTMDDDPPASTGKYTVRFNEGTEKQEDIDVEAPSREAATIEAARTYSIEHSGAYPSTAKIIAPMAPSLAMEAWQRRALGEERPPF